MRPSCVIATVAISMGLCAGVALAQPSTSASGHWEGNIDVPGQPLAISVELSPTAGGAWRGAISIPAQNVSAFPLSDITVKDADVGFAMKGVPGDPTFTGKVAGEPRTISGQMTQGGMSMPFTLTWKGEAKIEAPPKSTKVTSDFEGTWEGTLSAGGNQLRLIVKLANEGEAARGTMVSLDQGDGEIPITQIIQAGSKLTLVVGPISGRYEGELKAGEIEGTWTQGPQSFPLVFKRQAK
jgi:hypothetical protein